MSYRTSAEIREQIDHPIIDSDAHTIEYLPDVSDRVREIAGQEVQERLDRMFYGLEHYLKLPAEARRTMGAPKIGWNSLPTDTYDRATAMLPRLMYERLDEFGIDFATVYTTYGMFPLASSDDEVRRAGCRAINLYNADVFQGLGDRMIPVAVIPMSTPEEAIAELDFAVGEKGFRAIVMQAHALRPRPGQEDRDVPAVWMDNFGIDSQYDYEPVWRRCVELGVSPTFHSGSMGSGSRVSVTNYVQNHIGNFGVGGEGICRSMIFDGVATRHPELRFAFLEGGVNWASGLYTDTLGHYEKRNGKDVHQYDLERIDRDALHDYFTRYGTKSVTERLGEGRLEKAVGPLSFSPGDNGIDAIDEFERSGIKSPEDVKTIFERNFFFGCEADDPQNAGAFDTKKRPLGARMNAIFSSDIGHWDVPDMRKAMPEAWELVDDGLIDTDNFRDFVFRNPVALWTGTNPRFFEGTRVEDAVAKLS